MKLVCTYFRWLFCKYIFYTLNETLQRFILWKCRQWNWKQFALKVDIKMMVTSFIELFKLFSCGSCCGVDISQSLCRMVSFGIIWSSVPFFVSSFQDYYMQSFHQHWFLRSLRATCSCRGWRVSFFCLVSIFDSSYSCDCCRRNVARTHDSRCRWRSAWWGRRAKWSCVTSVSNGEPTASAACFPVSFVVTRNRTDLGRLWRTSLGLGSSWCPWPAPAVVHGPTSLVLAN